MDGGGGVSLRLRGKHAHHQVGTTCLRFTGCTFKHGFHRHRHLCRALAGAGSCALWASRASCAPSPSPPSCPGGPTARAGRGAPVQQHQHQQQRHQEQQAPVQVTAPC